MNITELLSTIDAKRGAQVLLHPYGFLQLSLTDTTWRDSGYRLHIWSNELPSMKMSEFQVHDHIYNINSKVLIGELKDTRYTVKGDSNGQYVVFKAANGKLINTKMKVS